MTLGFSLGQADIQAYIPHTGIWWSRQVLCEIIMTLGYSLCMLISCSPVNMRYEVFNIEQLVFNRKDLCERSDKSPPHKHNMWINTRQVMQITYAALYKQLGLLAVTVYNCVSTSPHHIFLYQMYGNVIKTIFTADQVTHILPLAVYYITTPRYYFQFPIEFATIWIRLTSSRCTSL